jgi:hypothetical protein
LIAARDRAPSHDGGSMRDRAGPIRGL